MFSASQLGLDPFELHLMGRESGFDEEGNDIGPVNIYGKPVAGKPKWPQRYQRFLMACGIVAFEMQAQASGAKFGGTEESKGSQPSSKRVGMHNR